MTATDIRTDVPMDIHPGVLLDHQDALDIPQTMGPAVLHSAHAALSEIYSTIGKLQDATAAWEAAAPKATRVPNANGDYVHSHMTKEKLRVRDQAHWAAWKIHLLAIQPTAEVEVAPNVA